MLFTKLIMMNFKISNKTKDGTKLQAALEKQFQ